LDCTRNGYLADKYPEAFRKQEFVMNAEEFVTALKSYVQDAAVEDTIANLRRPPGRRIFSENSELSHWYNALSPAERNMVDKIISMSVRSAVFGLLAVLDGARTIDVENGRFELYHIAEKRVLLNHPEGHDLHDLFNS
jgi:hypothetical protein